MADCVVCRYWSERLEENRALGRSKRALKQERRLMMTLRTHQIGACARKFPDLLRDLVKEELDLPDKTLGSCDPARARILIVGPSNDAGAMCELVWRVDRRDSNQKRQPRTRQEPLWDRAHFPGVLRSSNHPLPAQLYESPASLFWRSWRVEHDRRQFPLGNPACDESYQPAAEHNEPAWVAVCDRGCADPDWRSAALHRLVGRVAGASLSPHGKQRTVHHRPPRAADLVGRTGHSVCGTRSRLLAVSSIPSAEHSSRIPADRV